jgi:hypothetical protein
MAKLEDQAVHKQVWLAKLRQGGLYAVAVAVGASLPIFLIFFDGIIKVYDRFQTHESFVLAENSAKSAFSDQLAQRAWRRIFWADIFRTRVVNGAPIADIDTSWKAYIDADAEWNANFMISTIGLERYYDSKRSSQLEGKIQDLFSQLDTELAKLRRSELSQAIRAGNTPTPQQKSDAESLDERANDISNALKIEFYKMIRCLTPVRKARNKDDKRSVNVDRFVAPESKGENAC